MLNHIDHSNQNGHYPAGNSSTPNATPKMVHRSVAHIYLPANSISSSPTPPQTPTPTANRARTPNSRAASPQGTPTTPTTPTHRATTPPSTDVIGAVLGDFGIWQLRTVLILFLCKLPASWFMACIIYTAPELQPPEYECDARGLNASQTISSDQCYVLDWAPGANATSGGGEEQLLGETQCKRFIYDYDFMSLIMQFDLVCAREIFVAWTQFWHLFGVLVGGVLATKVMLKLSPRTVYIIGMVVQIMFGVVTGYARDFNVHCIFRCLSAICCALMFTSAQAIFVDITAGRYRTGIIILYDTFWSIGLILLPGISSFFNNWTYLYLGITFPTIFLLMLLKWTPESPRWLLKNGYERDIHQVECTIRHAADINERTFLVPVDLRQQLEQLRETLRAQPAPAGWFQLWRGKNGTIYMLAAHTALACYIVNYMGMLLNIRSFGREYRVPNTIAMAFGEIIGCFVALHFALKQNRWKFQYAGAFNIIAGLIGCLGWTFTYVTLNPGLKVSLWMIIAVVPKASVSCAQSLMQACMAEVMPPNKKAPFVFSVVTWARIWLLSAPFINVLKKIDVALSLTAFALLTVLGGFCTAMLQTPNAQPRLTNMNGNQPSNKKERSPLTMAVWTVEEEFNNTRL